MGCFSLFPCFTSSKSKHHPKLNNYANTNQGYYKSCETAALIKLPIQESTNLESVQTPVFISRERYDSEDQVINESDNKTFVIDSDVETNKDVSAEDIKFLCVQIENERKDEIKDDLGVRVGTGNDDKIVTEAKEESDGEKEVKEEVKKEVQSGCVSDSSVSSYISYPPMHRYHSHVINEDDERLVIQEESSESLFSLSIDPRKQSKSCLVEVDEKEVNSPLKPSSSSKIIVNENDSLLNPVENLAQWKPLMKVIPPMMPSLDLYQEKENLYLEQEDMPIPVSEDPSFKVPDIKGKVKNDTNVTTSLSSWLVDPEKSVTVSKDESQYSTGNSYAYSDEVTSWKSIEDRPILGAWTIDEVKQLSARSSPRKSPCRNPDETPIIGTVGSYWSHTKQGADSSSSCASPFGMSANSRRNRETKALSCHSSPTKRRLDRAFNKTAV